MTETDWLRLVYLLAVLVLIWPVAHVIRRSRNTLAYIAIWLAILTVFVAGYLFWMQ
jgi:hypothetical protein